MPEAIGNYTVQDIIMAFTAGEFDHIPELVQIGLDLGLEPGYLLNEGLIMGIRQVGEQFRKGEVYVPEMLLGTRALEDAVKLIEPLLGDKKKELSRGTVVIGTVKGDIHSLGKNIVITLLKSSGFEVIDLGVDVPASKFISEAKKHHADIIALSALMTTTVPQQKEVIEHLEASGIREDYFVMIGGASSNQKWAMEIKADGYGATAADAVALAETFMNKGRKRS